MKIIARSFALTLSFLAAQVHAQDMHWQWSGSDFTSAVDLSVDITGDGLPDAIVGDRVFSEVRVHSGVDGSEVLAVFGPYDEEHGTAVLGIPDLNGDGRGEIGFTDRYGDLFVHDGQTGVRMRAVDAGTYAPLAAMGDVNGDGYGDVAFGFPVSSGGGVRIVSGRYIVDGTGPEAVWTVHGTRPGGRFGTAIAAIRDVDSDGVDDVIVGAPEENGVIGLYAYFGRVHCLSGATGELIWTKVFYDTVSTRFGAAVASIGDVNGDFVEDVLVGAPANDTGGPDAGAGFVLSGTTGWFVEQYYHDVAGERFGSEVASAGDQDQDGTPDPLFGAEYAASFAGRAYLYSGATMDLIRHIDGHGQLGRAGSMSGAVDATGDGEPDFLLGSPEGLGVAELWGAGCNGSAGTFCASSPKQQWPVRDAARPRIAVDLGERHDSRGAPVPRGQAGDLLLRHARGPGPLRGRLPLRWREWPVACGRSWSRTVVASRDSPSTSRSRRSAMDPGPSSPATFATSSTGSATRWDRAARASTSRTGSGSRSASETGGLVPRSPRVGLGKP